MSSSCASATLTSLRTRSKRPARSLQVGHAHGVFVAHPQRQVARGLHRQRRRCRRRRCAPCAPGTARHRPGPGSRWCGAGLRPARAGAASLNWLCSALQQRIDGRVRMACGGSAGTGRGGGPAGGGGSSASRRPSPKARRLASTPTPPRADRGLEGLAAEGQRGRCAQRAEQHRADDAAAALGRRGHVEADEALRRIGAGGFQRGAVGHAVAQRRLLGDGIDAVGGGDQRRALLRHQAALHRAAGFHQLGGDQHVHVARRGDQRQHRRGAGGLGRGAREQLQVVDGGAGALRHAGHRGGLRDVAVGLAQGDDPVGEHAAALAAHGQDGDLDRLGVGDHRPSEGGGGQPPVDAALQRADDPLPQPTRAAGPRHWGC